MLTFLLPAGTNALIDARRRQIDLNASLRPGITVRVKGSESFTPQTLAIRLLALQGQAKGVGLIAQGHPIVQEAIRTLTRPPSTTSEAARQASL